MEKRFKTYQITSAQLPNQNGLNNPEDDLGKDNLSVREKLNCVLKYLIDKSEKYTWVDCLANLRILLQAYEWKNEDIEKKNLIQIISGLLEEKDVQTQLELIVIIYELLEIEIAMPHNSVSKICFYLVGISSKI